MTSVRRGNALEASVRVGNMSGGSGDCRNITMSIIRKARTFKNVTDNNLVVTGTLKLSFLSRPKKDRRNLLASHVVLTTQAACRYKNLGFCLCHIVMNVASSDFSHGVAVATRYSYNEPSD